LKGVCGDAYTKKLTGMLWFVPFIYLFIYWFDLLFCIAFIWYYSDVVCWNLSDCSSFSCPEVSSRLSPRHVLWCEDFEWAN
jgi:hypothetical protein